MTSTIITQYSHKVTTQLTINNNKVTSHMNCTMGKTNIPCDYLSDPQVQPGNQSLWANSNTSAFLSAHPWNTREMGIEVLHPAEGVVCLHTARDPAEEGPLPGRVTGAHIAVFPHGLPDVEVLLAVRAGEGLICFRPVHSMGHFMSAAFIPCLLA